MFVASRDKSSSFRQCNFAYHLTGVTMEKFLQHALAAAEIGRWDIVDAVLNDAIKAAQSGDLEALKEVARIHILIFNA